VINNSYEFKVYESWRILAECLKTNCKREGLGTLLKKDSVSLLSQEGQGQRHCSKRQASKEMGLTQSSIIQIIHRDLDPKCLFHVPTCLMPISVRFSYIYISQGSVAMQSRCGGIFNNYFIANCPHSVPVKVLKIGKYLAKTWTKTKWEVFLGHSVLTVFKVQTKYLSKKQQIKPAVLYNFWKSIKLNFSV